MIRVFQKGRGIRMNEGRVSRWQRHTHVSADLKGSQSGWFGMSQEGGWAMAGHTNASTAVSNEQSRFRVCSPLTISSSWALLPRRPLEA
jgi:hypothetical protein